MRFFNVVMFFLVSFFQCIANAQDFPKFYGLYQASTNDSLNFDYLKKKGIKDSKNRAMLIIPPSVSKRLCQPQVGDTLWVVQKSKPLDSTTVKKLFVDTSAEEIAGVDTVRFETDKNYIISEKWFPLFIQLPANIKTADLPTVSKTIELTDNEYFKALDSINADGSEGTIAAIKYQNEKLKIVMWSSANNLFSAIYQKGKWIKSTAEKDEAEYSFDQTFKVMGEIYIVLDLASSGGYGLAVFRVGEGKLDKVFSVYNDSD